MKKNLFAFISLLAAALCSLFLFACTGEDNTDKQGLKFLQNSDGTYTVMGSSNITDAEILIPGEYNGKAVTSIGNDAFSHCDGLTSITIPNSVTSIGDWAFNHCTGLTSITIPDSVTSIGSCAFHDCTGLTSITIGKGVTSIRQHAFDGCTGLTSITIPDSVTSIEYGTFDGCTSLTYNEYDNALYLGNDDNPYVVLVKGKQQGIISCTIHNNAKVIYSSAFEDCTELTSITIPDSVTSIGDKAFSHCDGLTSITIPDSVTSIGDWAFNHCTGLTSITIPDSVTSIGYCAFEYCTGLTSITIGKGVTSIADRAFEDCTGLTSITIPDSVTSIGDCAFLGCGGLTSVTYTGDLADWCRINGLYGFMFYSGHRVILTIDGKEILGELIIPDSVTSIGDGAFTGCKGLTSITIPDSVTSIGEHVFEGCTGLTSITIPDSVTSIGYSAFGNCTGLTIYCEAANIPWDSSWNDSGCPLIWDCNNNDKDSGGYSYSVINEVRYKLNDGIATVVRQSTALSGSIEISAFITYNGKDFSVTSIEDGAFDGCFGLTSIAIPDSITSIGDLAFRNTGLTSITIPDSVTSIGEDAFYGCTGLTSITIPDSVTSIGYCAFEYCTELKIVYYKGTPDEWRAIDIGYTNSDLTSATRYYYSETQPTEKGNYWRYVDGVPTAWQSAIFVLF